MKLGVVGSRTFDNYQLLESTLSILKNVELIVSGNAAGADKLSERYAKEHNIPTMIFPAEWGIYGKSAGFRRNLDIVRNSDGVICFWDGVSRGTKLTIDLCKKNHKPVKIIYF